MKFFVDTADVAEIRDLNETGLLDGVTTNPSLIMKAGKPIHVVIKEICDVVEGEVSAEVAAVDFAGMMQEGQKLAAIAKNVAVKVPLTWDGLKACRALRQLGHKVNVTLCFSANQALLAAKSGATFISPFIGRLDDTNIDGMELIEEIRAIYDNYNFDTQILAASIRYAEPREAGCPCRRRRGDRAGRGAEVAGQASAHRQGTGAVPGRLEEDRAVDRLKLRYAAPRIRVTIRQSSLPMMRLPRPGTIMDSSNTLLITAAPDLRQAALDWAAHLGRERRLSDNTLEAYGRDLEQFFRFLTGHLGEPPSLSDISALTPADVRAFMAHRRGDGVGARTLGRQIAALRSFARFCQRRGLASTTAFTSVRPPKQPKSLPKALSITDSARVIEMAEAFSEEPWIAARDRAALTLLYGCGLRISEALGIKAADAPTGKRDTIRVIGKGGRERVVPVLPAVRRAVEDYIRLAPFPLEPDEPLFRGARGGPLSPRIIQIAIARLRGALGLEASVTPHALRHSFATHLLGPRRRSPHHPGAVRPRQPVDHADLHERRFRAAARGLSQSASEGLDASRQHEFRHASSGTPSCLWSSCTRPGTRCGLRRQLDPRRRRARSPGGLAEDARRS